MSAWRCVRPPRGSAGRSGAATAAGCRKFAELTGESRNGEIIGIAQGRHHQSPFRIYSQAKVYFMKITFGIAQKMGVPAKQLHSYDYSGPYAGFNGAMNFARDVANCLTTPAWKFITPPWEQEPQTGDNHA